ncbi:regulatory helix-turn-helix LysR family protein [Aestuariispira insulae]|uniref:Regulatory helix-turn-helix LysR family protein n=2 Tax=Aestuariispira insulae TaxID=1461337 RepID=A0A3D9HX08_9PROT|nr:regulatory helix-turn-helix LysR family protein [Aestuariispira insulae]
MAAADNITLQDAAQSLGKSVAALSIQIKALEDIAGQPLFERAVRGKRSKLTDAGKLYYSRLQSSLNNLSPADLNRSLPTEVIELDFNREIDNQSPKLKKFWQDLSSIDFDLRNDPDKAYALKNVSLSFREENGQWIYHHIGRRNDYAEYKGWDYCRNAIGKVAMLRQPTGLFHPYDWTVTKNYNKVFVTGEPSLSRVQGWLDDANNTYRHVTYHRIVVRVASKDGPLIMVKGLIQNFDLPEPSLRPKLISLDVEQVESYSPFLARFYKAWQKNPLWNSSEIRALHPELMMCRPLRPHYETLVAAHIGERHNATLYFGNAWRETAIGVSISDRDIWGEFDEKINDGYYSTLNTGIPSFELLRAAYPHKSGRIMHAVYFRLMLRLFLSDGSPVLVNMLEQHGMEETSAAATVLAQKLLSRLSP